MTCMREALLQSVWMGSQREEGGGEGKGGGGGSPPKCHSEKNKLRSLLNC